MVIYLILLLPAGFSDLPKNVTGSHIVFCSVLLRMGFTCALSVTRQAVVSYTAFPPLPGEPGGLFLLHWPWSHLHRTLSGIPPYEARTFLTHLRGRDCLSYLLIYHIKSYFAYRGIVLPLRGSLLTTRENNCHPQTLLQWNYWADVPY